jgi:hypothetical protein
LLSQHCLGDRLELHVARAFVDRADLGVAVELFRRIILRVAVAAKSSSATEVTRSATCDEKSLAIAPSIAMSPPRP